MKLLGYIVSLCRTLWGTASRFPRHLDHLTFPPAAPGSDSSSHQLRCFPFARLQPSSRVWSSFSPWLWPALPADLRCSAPFLVPVGCASALEKCLFFNWLIVLLWLDCKSSLLGIRFYQTNGLQIYSLSLAFFLFFLFFFLTVSYELKFFVDEVESIIFFF